MSPVPPKYDEFQRGAIKALWTAEILVKQDNGTHLVVFTPDILHDPEQCKHFSKILKHAIPIVQDHLPGLMSEFEAEKLCGFNSGIAPPNAVAGSDELTLPFLLNDPGRSIGPMSTAESGSGASNNNGKRTSLGDIHAYGTWIGSSEPKRPRIDSTSTPNSQSSNGNTNNGGIKGKDIKPLGWCPGNRQSGKCHFDKEMAQFRRFSTHFKEAHLSSYKDRFEGKQCFQCDTCYREVGEHGIFNTNEVESFLDHMWFKHTIKKLAPPSGQNVSPPGEQNLSPPREQDSLLPTEHNLLPTEHNLLLTEHNLFTFEDQHTLPPGQQFAFSRA